jgi:hypothetical protein
MKRVLAIALGAASLSAASAAWADWSVGAGFESFRWKESTTPTVKESGLRWALDLTWAQSKEPGLSAGYNLKFYQGKVDYTGATLFGNLPISTEVDYRGLTNEIQAIWRTSSTVDAVFAAGWDRWERKLQASGQQEDWDVLYVKLGASMAANVKTGVIGSIGAKYPVWTRENANFPSIGATDNPRLRPGKAVSLYGTLGYRVNPRWDVIAYYDSYRFKESNVVAVPFPGVIQGFIQPESKMDVFGMKIQHNFQ